jgi:hypothetical protein
MQKNGNLAKKRATPSAESTEYSIVIRWLRNLCIGLFLSSLCTVYLSHGAVYPEALTISTMLMSLCLVIAYFTLGIAAPTRMFFLIVFSIWAIVVAWTIIQAMPLPAGIPGNAAWRVLQEAGIAASHSISPAPADTLWALGPISLPAMALLSVLLLFRSDGEIDRALTVFCAAGGVMAAFALIQFVAFPKSLMLAEKQHYIGSLTAPFVNRNTAATFYGVTLVAMISRFRGIKLRLIPGSDVFYRRDGWTPLNAALWLLIALITLSALVLTQSRGGVLATALALLCQIGVSAFFRFQMPSGGALPIARAPASWRRVLQAAALAALSVLVIGFFAGRVLLRAQMLGLEDGRLCVMPGILSAIRDHALVGIGSGAFPAVFPAYRDAACGLVGYWPMAHNFYLDGFLAIGLPFVFLAVVFLATIAFSFWTGINRRRSKRLIVIGAASATILVLIHSATDFSMQIPGFSVWWVLFIGLSIAVSYGRRTTVKVKN